MLWSKLRRDRQRSGAGGRVHRIDLQQLSICTGGHIRRAALLGDEGHLAEDVSGVYLLEQDSAFRTIDAGFQLA